MKKILHIAYYWPPCGGISVLRNSKLVKYARAYGWEPVVFGPEDAHYPVIDETTLDDIPPGTTVLRQKAVEPFAVFNVLQGRKAGQKVQDVFLVREKKPGPMHKLGVWIRGNFFIPDARMLWIAPSVRFLKKYVAEHRIDAILSSGPPHSSHRIAYHLKRATGLPWIADFQDPWTQIDYFEKFMLTDRARKKHYRMEREVLQAADHVTTVSPTWAQDFEKLSGRKVHAVTMGFDEDDFKGIAPVNTGKFVVSHLGTLGVDRNPGQLWAALSQLAAGDRQFGSDLQITLAGVVDYTVFEDIERLGLKPNLQYFAFLKRGDALAWMMGSHIQLLLLNKGYGAYNVKGRIPAKLFEYLGSGGPVLGLGETAGDVAAIIQNTRSGTMLPYEDTGAIKAAVLKYYTAWKEGKAGAHKPVNIEDYTFGKLTGDILGLLG